MRLGLLLAVLVLAAGAAGCGSGDEPGPPVTPAQSPAQSPAQIPTGAPPGSNRPTPASPDPLTGSPPAGATALPATQVDASALPAGLPGLVWTRGEQTVGVYGRAGGCTDSRVEVVEQTEARVALRVTQFSTGPGPCTRELRYPGLETTLAAPLGTRTVVLTGVLA